MDFLKPISDIFDKILGLIPDKNKAAEITKELELAKNNLEVTIQQEITDRAKADMMSDSWLSKNIRPISLITVSILYFLASILSYFNFNPSPKIIDILEYLLYMVFGFYFGGRTLEKSASMIASAIQGKK